MFNCKCESNKLARIGANNLTIMGQPNCIPQKWMCDGISDCDNNLDEKDCICAPASFQCSFCPTGKSCKGTIENNLYQCIPKNKTNDGVKNCLSGKDEK